MLAFLGPAAVGPFRTADEEVVRITTGGGTIFSVDSAAAKGDGDFGRPAPDTPFWFADKNGEAVRATMGGVPVLDGGLLGCFIVGLSHEEKKSSFGSPTGVEVPLVVAAKYSSATTTSPGWLMLRQTVPQGSPRWTYSCTSLAARRFSSSLYFVAALDVYFTFGSLLARAAVPPFDWKNLVADSFPPTFKIRSCSHCHTGSISASHCRSIPGVCN